MSPVASSLPSGVTPLLRAHRATPAHLALRAMMCAAALLLTAIAVRAVASELSVHVAAAKSDDERACLVASNGGYTPVLRDALAHELDEQRKARPQRIDLSLVRFLERLGREQHDVKAVAMALNAAATVDEKAKRWKPAEALYEEAAALARSCGDDVAVADALYGLSFVHRDLGYGEAVLPDLQEALAASERAGTRKTTGLLLNAVGLWKRNNGELDASIADMERARAIFVELDDAEGVAGITNNLGGGWKELGDFDKAVETFEQAIRYAEKINNDRIISYALNNLGSVYIAKGDYGRAEAVFQRSIELKRKLHDPTVNTTELNLGEIARKRRRSHEAFVWYERSLADGSAISNWEHIAEALCDLAVLAGDDGRPHLALYAATGAASLSKQHNLVGVFVAAMSTRGEALRALGQPEAARAAFEEAIAAIEEERTHAAAGPEQRRALFLEPRLDPYFGMISLLRASHPRDALAYAEQTKARVLLDLLQSAPIDAAAPVKVGDDEAAIELVTTEHETIVFVLTGSRVQTRRIAIDGTKLARDVHTFRERIAQRDLAIDVSAAALFRQLFSGVWPLISGKRRLIIVPDGPLWELPFAALVTPDGHYLIEHATITLAPSLHALAAMRALEGRAAPRLGLIAFGNPSMPGGLPPLPEAEEQVRAIARMYGASSRVYAGSDATETRLKSEIGNARVIHIATHGALNDANPMYSHLVLGADARNDGFLNAREIPHLPLRSDLVVLSACETARGRTHQGEGVIGLAWAFFLAGCPSTVVSQWSVDAATTTTLMIRFHERLRAGDTKSAAMRDAALSVLHDPKSRHPFYWAPFVLIGDDAAIRRVKGEE